MSHEVEKMQKRGSLPWHRRVTDENGNTTENGQCWPADVRYTATEAAEQIGGLPHIEVQPLMVEVGGEMVESGFFLHRRTDTGAFLGSPVTSRYNDEMTPYLFCETYDKNVINPDTGEISPIETIWLLKQGELFGLTTKLPDIEVAGEPVEQYFNLGSPYDGKSGIEAMISRVCVVCANTWAMNLAMGEDGTNTDTYERHTINHTSDVVEYTAGWMRKMYREALDRATLTAEVYNILAQRQVSDIEVKWIIESSLPGKPEPLEWQYPDDTTEFGKKHKAWVRDEKNRVEWIDLVYRLSQGEQTGYNDFAGRRGTLWGTFNAFTEAFNYGASQKKDGGLKNLYSAGYTKSVMSGWRHTQMMSGLSCCQMVAEGKHLEELTAFVPSHL